MLLIVVHPGGSESRMQVSDETIDDLKDRGAVEPYKGGFRLKE